MDWQPFQTIFNLVVAVALPAIGWFAREIFDDVKMVKASLNEHKVEVAKTYATNSDMTRIEDKLDRILDKIERKQDR